MLHVFSIFIGETGGGSDDPNIFSRAGFIKGYENKLYEIGLNTIKKIIIYVSDDIKIECF